MKVEPQSANSVIVELDSGLRLHLIDSDGRLQIMAAEPTMTIGIVVRNLMAYEDLGLHNEVQIISWADAGETA